MVFSTLIYAKQHRAAAEFLFDTVIEACRQADIHVNIDRETNVADLERQLKEVEKEVSDKYRERELSELETIYQALVPALQNRLTGLVAGLNKDQPKNE
jgi:uncharacterized protein (DUF3084 family)